MSTDISRDFSAAGRVADVNGVSEIQCPHELGQIGHLHATLPWSIAAYDHAQKIMGEDYWPYGIPENRNELQALMRYTEADGLIPGPVPLEELFAKSTFDRFNF